jgi:maltose-binding protein MalE
MIWKVDDIVFFDSSQKQAILLLLEQDTSINAKMDDINLIYAKWDNDKWKFYYSSMPVITAPRYYNKKALPEKPYTFKELSDIGIRKILKGGYFWVGSCKINDNYISKWYTISLEEKNKIFHRR